MVETNCGRFTIRIEPERSPHAAASFVALARGRYYDRTVFSRIVPGVLIEAGDPTATGTGGPGYATRDTPPPNTTYARGVVAMAKPDGAPPGTSGSRFFVVTAADAQLPPEHAIIGEVVEGLDVVERIGVLGGDDELPTEVQNTSGLPTRIVEIERATVVIS